MVMCATWPSELNLKHQGRRPTQKVTKGVTPNIVIVQVQATGSSEGGRMEILKGVNGGT
jgi:hypothetical protein